MYKKNGCWICKWMFGWLEDWEDAELTEQPGECHNETAIDQGIEPGEKTICHHWASNPEDWCD